MATSNFFDPDWRASTGNVKLTNNDVLRINKDYPNIRESVAATQGSDRRVCRKLMTPSGCAFLHCWLSSIDGEDAEIFFDWVEFTENIPREHPAQLLKNKLSEIQAGKSLGWKEKRMIYAVTFRAWNAVRDGEEIKVLRWSTTTKYPTPY